MEKQNLYLIYIVAIVAIVAIIAMIIGVTRITIPASTTQTSDSLGAAYTAAQNSQAKGTECQSASTDTHGACVNGFFARCGDGFLYSGVEQCETTTLNGKSCQSFGYSGGTLQCTDCVYDTSGCTN